jgi:predicted lactoylglutathione lyase
VRSKQILRHFINLPVHDLDRSCEFFRELGFEFNPKFSDENMTCMIIGERTFVMLIAESKFREFAAKPVADASRTTETILAFEVGSRDEVDDFVDEALAAGAARAAEPMDEDFIYIRSFYDLDGHHWEVLAMDESAMPQ